MRRALFVVGMHRSGTSAITGALRHAGFAHPTALMPPQPDNPDGFFEPLPVVRLNNAILELAGGTWHRLPLLLDMARMTPRPLGDIAAAQYGPAAAAAWAAAFEGLAGGDVVAKDPRFCLTLPLWLATAGAAGFAAEVLVIARAPDAIALSLCRRNGFTLAQSLDLVADHWAQLLAAAPPDARILDAEAFRTAPAEALAAVGYPVPRGAALSPRPAPFADELVPPALVPPPLRALANALRAAHGRRLADADLPDPKALGRERAVRKLYAGNTYLVADEPPVAAVARQPGRTVLYHLHIFKNAGSSVDVILKENFGLRWHSREFATRADHSNADLVNTFIRRTPDVAALSSHTGDWWLDHADETLNVLPILFLREPLLRIRSAYTFEQRQNADTVGAQLAKRHDFRGYVAARLARPHDFAFRNFQARRLAALDSRLPTDLRAAAFRALDRAPFVGIVEEFDASLVRLERAVRPLFPDFRAFAVHANRTAGEPEADIAAAVGRVRAELGEPLAEELAAANAIDLALYEAARARYAPAPEPAEAVSFAAAAAPPPVAGAAHP